jgi:hypothetical protein
LVESFEARFVGKKVFCQFFSNFSRKRWLVQLENWEITGIAGYFKLGHWRMARSRHYGVSLMAICLGCSSSDNGADPVRAQHARRRVSSALQ